MSVELERFSWMKSPVQARTLQKLWAEAEQPVPEETLRRYRDYPHAFKNVVRLAATEAYEAYIVFNRDEEAEERGRTAIGTASIIFGAGLARVGDGTIYEGNDLDYRFANEQDDRVHQLTAMELVYESSRRELGRSGAPRTTGPGQGDISVTDAVNNVIVTTPVGSEHNRGLHAFTTPEGEPARYLELEDAPIPEISAGDELLQLYTGRYFVEKEMFHPTNVKRIG